MNTLPTIDFCGHQVSRLICGGNPISGHSHVTKQLDREMREYYTMDRILALLAECDRCGINTLQSRGDAHQMRMMLEHRLAGGKMHWIVQTASEFADIPRHIDQIARHEPIAIYNHGTHTDNCWHAGNMDPVLANLETIKSRGLPAGVGTHVPEVIEYVEEQGWPTDFYMGCFYNIARGHKAAPATDPNAYDRDKFPADDPAKMTAVLRQVAKPCLGFKILAASRNCGTPGDIRGAFEFAFENLKPTDAVVVGMFPKHSNQVAENAAIVREILAGQ